MIVKTINNNNTDILQATKVTDKRVLLMDEVDGMAGNEDRGGVQELIALIKDTRVPIICMCNDRNHPKIRSLVNHCFDLRFAKPRLEQIKGAMMSVCFKEGIKISPDALTQIINGTGMDIRQTLNHLSMWTASQQVLTAEEAEKKAGAAKKDTVLGMLKKLFKNTYIKAELCFRPLGSGENGIFSGGTQNDDFGR